MFEHCVNCLSPLDYGEFVCPSCGYDNSQYTVEPHHLTPGTILNNKYEVGRVLGEGGFGITYVGRDTVLDMKVAIKEFFMHGYVSRNNSFAPTISVGTGTYAQTFSNNKEKFVKEARVLAKFSDESGIVGIRDYFEANNTAYLVMDFIQGQTFDKFLAKHGKMSWQNLYPVLKPVFRLLSIVHKENIIHRDISPDNIMITDGGIIKILDFGAARNVSQTDVKSLSVILKPGYAPEEQYRSKGHQGPWTDVYALCATIYRALTGIVPDDSMERLVDDKVLPPVQAGADCPPAVSMVIMKGMAVRQTDRYQSISELCDDIERAVNNPGSFTISTNAVDENQTVFAGTAASQPVVSQPRYSQPAVSQPRYSQPVVSQPGYSQPAVSQPGYSQPVPSQPVYNQQRPPVQAQPVYNQQRPPVQAQPVYNQQRPPVQAQPVYNQQRPPVQAQPVYNQQRPPVQAQPVYNQQRPPVQSQPVYNQQRPPVQPQPVYNPPVQNKPEEADSSSRRSGGKAGLILGIVTIVLAFLPYMNIFALVTGLVGTIMSAVKIRSPKGIIGLVLSVLGLILALVFMVVYADAGIYDT